MPSYHALQRSKTGRNYLPLTPQYRLRLRPDFLIQDTGRFHLKVLKDWVGMPGSVLHLLPSSPALQLYMLRRNAL